MKLAFSTSGDSQAAVLDARSGRAPKFLVYDLEVQSFEVIDNHQNLEAAQGAGIQTTQNIVVIGAAAIVTGHCAPKAFRVLQASGIKVFHSEADTVAVNLAKALMLASKRVGLPQMRRNHTHYQYRLRAAHAELNLIEVDFYRQD